MTKDCAVWQARATAWEFLALTFRYPEATLVEVVSSGEWAEAATEIADALGIELPEASAEDFAGLANYAKADSEALLHTLRAEATRLFVGAPTPAVSPYEGVHRAEADGVQALLFVNPHTMDVERFMKSCGLGQPEGTNEPLDHVATECELLQYLACLAAGIMEAPEQVNPADFPGGSPEAAYATFLDEHLRVWAPAFIQKVQAETREPFYRAAAGLLAAQTG